ncbi:MAG: hypothetical protein KA109_17230 [Saprospiraceae bacterium]|nr:hypothetical protein [Saprospiraceae bacterium]MBP8095221.1 hypothetical protein [Saprospiraceae bacterium]
MKFSDIPGMETEKKRLVAFVQQDRLPHALLIHGPEGSAKLALALAFSSYLMCENPQDGQACGECLACLKTFKLIHPDIHYFFPLSGKENKCDECMPDWRRAVLENPYLTAPHWQEIIAKENKLLNISADECRIMVKKLSLTIYEGKYRILLIWLPEYLGTQGNILLKLIEEPPANSLILLVTESVQSLIATIVSRCQTLAIPRFTDENIKVTLSKFGLKDDLLITNIARTAEGNMYEAIRMGSDQTNPHSEQMIRWLRLCFKNKANELISWCEDFATEGRDTHRQFLKYGLNFLDQILRYKVTGQEISGFNPDEWKGIKGLSTQLEIEDIRLMSELFNDHIVYIERNANPKILFSALSLNIHQLFSKQKVHQFRLI